MCSTGYSNLRRIGNILPIPGDHRLLSINLDPTGRILPIALLSARALISICAAGGQGVVAIIER
ncbi:hypothetical protein [Nocardia asteroides]